MGQSNPCFGVPRDGAECEDLAWEKAEVLHSHHCIVALVRTQMARLLEQDTDVTLALATSPHVSKLGEVCGQLLCAVYHLEHWEVWQTGENWKRE